jgi:Asp-tRNA(Asn)/Glu-tRNA(Gln) amidotransferase A subunit family amidase
MERARELDRRPASGLLYGLPLGIKDVFDTYDLRTTYGSPIYTVHRPRTDAAAVALCREAGAVVLGKTVTAEFACRTPGPTRHPLDSERTPGGSSSGSAAAVADCMVPLALGTQTAGSIIRPAAFCGIVGFKPSFGSVPRAGTKSLSESLDTMGGFARTVEDVALLGAVLAGADRLPSLELHKRPRVGICKTPMWEQADADSQAALLSAARMLSSAGAQVEDICLHESLQQLTRVQIDIMAFEAARALAHERLQHPDQLSANLLEVLAAGRAISFDQHQNNQYAARLARQRIDAYFDQYDVLLTPSAIGEAPLGIHVTGDSVFSRMWTLLGLPCVHLPFASGAHDLPVGVQAVGRFSMDAELLSMANWIHKKLTQS